MDRHAEIAIRIAASTLDQVIRVSILEGVAGVSQGVWTRHPQSLMKAQAWFAAWDGPKLDPVWFQKQDTGIYRAMYFMALKILRVRERAEDIVASVLAGQTRSDESKGQMYSLGKSLRDNPVFKVALSRMVNHVKHRCLDEVQRHAPESSLTMLTDMGEETTRDVPSRAPSDDDTFSAIVEQLISDRGGAFFKQIRQEIERHWGDRASYMEIFDAFISHPNLSDVGIARLLGHGEQDPVSWINRGAATYVSRVRRHLVELLPQIIKQKPALLKEVVMQQELNQLGYGTAHWAKSAKNLAQVISAMKR